MVLEFVPDGASLIRQQFRTDLLEELFEFHHINLQAKSSYRFQTLRFWSEELLQPLQSRIRREYRRLIIRPNLRE